MAIVTSMWLKGAKKRLGGTVIYQAMGQTRQRELAVEVSNPRTQSQMGQRVKWANLVNFYRANRSWMKYAYESKKASQSEYNKFMSFNVAGSSIFLTKTEAAAGACVCAPYLVTQGSLPSIEVVSGEDEYQTNIYLSAATKMDVGVSVGTLAQDLLDNNPGLRAGDQISLIRITQLTNSDNGLPYIVVRKYEMLLDLEETRPWNNFLPKDIIGPSTNGSKDLIAVFGNGGSGGFAMILSRTISGKTYVSSQRIVVVNNAALIDYYSSNNQLAAAVNSYGQSDNAFLSAVSANTNNQAPAPLSILAIRKGDSTKVANSEVDVSGWQTGDIIGVVFNRPLESATSIRVILTTDKESSGLVTPTIQGGVIEGTIAEFWDTSNAYLNSVLVDIDGVRYDIQFSRPDYSGSIE